MGFKINKELYPNGQDFPDIAASHTKMKIAYIAHPVSGDLKGNLEKIRLIVRTINLNEPNVLPFAPYWLDCHALDDSNLKERERGIKNDHELFRRSFIDEVWVYGISPGVLIEIDLANELHIPVIYKA